MSDASAQPSCTTSPIRTTTIQRTALPGRPAADTGFFLSAKRHHGTKFSCLCIPRFLILGVCILGLILFLAALVILPRADPQSDSGRTAMGVLSFSVLLCFVIAAFQHYLFEEQGVLTYDRVCHSTHSLLPPTVRAITAFVTIATDPLWRAAVLLQLPDILPADSIAVSVSNVLLWQPLPLPASGNCTAFSALLWTVFVLAIIVFGGLYTVAAGLLTARPDGPGNQRGTTHFNMAAGFNSLGAVLSIPFSFCLLRSVPCDHSLIGTYYCDETACHGVSHIATIIFCSLCLLLIGSTSFCGTAQLRLLDDRIVTTDESAPQMDPFCLGFFIFSRGIVLLLSALRYPALPVASLCLVVELSMFACVWMQEASSVRILRQLWRLVSLQNCVTALAFFLLAVYEGGTFRLVVLLLWVLSFVGSILFAWFYHFKAFRSRWFEAAADDDEPVGDLSGVDFH